MKHKKKPIKKIDAIAYGNYSKFQCSTNCIDKCCRITTWKIMVDQKAMDLYNSLEGEDGQMVRDGIQEIDGKYYFKTDDNQYCSMYDTDGLCKIHKKYGAKYLCTTCTVFPRKYVSYNDILHIGLTNSCPEVVKMFIMNKEPIGFGMYTMDNKTQQEKGMTKSYMSEPMCFKIRGVCSDMLQERSIPLLERIFYMGEFLDKLDESYKETNTGKEFNKIIKHYQSRQYFYQDINAALYSKFPEKNVKESLYKPFYKIIRGVVGYEVARDENTEFYDKINVFFNDFEKIEEMGIGKLIERLLAPYLREHEYVFENYLVSNLFLNRFPVENESLKDAYLNLLFEYLVLQLFIVGVFNKSESLTDEDIVNAIYYCSRKTSHSRSFKDSMQSIISQLQKLNLSVITYVDLISVE